MIKKALLEVYSGVKRALGDILDFIDKRRIVRRLFLVACGYMTYVTWETILEKDSYTTEDAALLGVVNALMGAIIKFYNDARSSEKSE